MSTEHDKSVDKVLEALRRATPPEGMEQRITQRLAQSPSPAPHPARRWVNLLTGSGFAGAWWRGAVTGAAVGLLAAGLFFFATHRTSSIPARVPESAANQRPTTPTVISATGLVSASAGEAQAHPCAHQAVFHVQPATPRPTGQRLIAETPIDSAAPSHPAPAMPLTAEERGLLQLAHTPDPKALAAPNPEAQAMLEAQEAAEFQKFFSPPPGPDRQRK